MIPWDELITRALEALIAGIGAIGAALISGLILLRIHHKKVREELQITAGEALLQHRQAVYAGLWKMLHDFQDSNWGLLRFLNWRKLRALQTTSLLATSPEVIDCFNRIVELYHKIPRTIDPTEQGEQGLEVTRLTKELWNHMRKDLYGTEPIPPEKIKFSIPGPRTVHAVEVWDKHRISLESVGIFQLEDLSQMDVDQVSQKTAIQRQDLAELVSMAKLELQFKKEPPLMIPFENAEDLQLPDPVNWESTFPPVCEPYPNIACLH